MALCDDPSRRRVVVLGPVCVATLCGDAAGGRVATPDLELAVGKRDMPTPFQIDRELVPFRCADCDASSCGGHWKTETAFDQDFYECTLEHAPEDTQGAQD